MLCNRPELASRYPKTMYEELTEAIFADDTKEIVFYAACLTMYRFTLLVSNSTIPQNLKRFKWHMLPLVWAIVNGKEVLRLNSRAAERGAQAVIDVMGQHGARANETFNRIAEICTGLGEVTADRLKRQAILQEMLALV
jgi:hypothetical protein